MFTAVTETTARVESPVLGTNHMDGNTRLCTATAAAALKETFGCPMHPRDWIRATRPAPRVRADRDGSHHEPV